MENTGQAQKSEKKPHIASMRGVSYISTVEKNVRFHILISGKNKTVSAQYFCGCSYLNVRSLSRKWNDIFLYKSSHR